MPLDFLVEALCQPSCTETLLLPLPADLALGRSLGCAVCLARRRPLAGLLVAFAPPGPSLRRCCCRLPFLRRMVRLLGRTVPPVLAAVVVEGPVGCLLLLASVPLPCLRF